LGDAVVSLLRAPVQ